MSESTARAERYEPQHAPSPFYQWEVAKKPVSVQIPFPIIDRLEHEAVESFRSLSSKGSEIGGLLYGTVSPGEPIIVTLDDYELIACDYSRGPLYRLSDADSGRFEKAIQLHGAPGALAVVGLFRSHTRKGLSLDAEDLAFFDSRFRDPHHIALLIRPFATKASTAGIFIRESGVVQGEASYLEFPFRSSQLTPGKTGADTPDGMPTPSAPRAAARAQIVPIASRREAPTAVPPLAVEPMAPVSQAVQAPEQPKQAAVAPPVVESKTAVETKPAEPKVEAKVETPKAPAAKETPKPAVKETPKSPAAKETSKPVAKETPKPAPAKEVAKPAATTKTEEKSDKLARKETTVVAPSPAPVIAPAEEAKSGNMLKIVLGALAVVVLLVSLFVYPGFLRHGKTGTPLAQDASQLSLRVERSGGEILLTWNRDSDVVKNAVHAVLSINDGDQHDNVDMDLSQLRNGSISYSPATADVVFKMEVTGKGDVKTASESVRALRTRPSPVTTDATTPQPAAAQTPGKPPVPGATPPAPNTTAATQTPANNAAAQPPAGAPPVEEAATKAPERVLRPFKAEPLAQRLHPVAAADLPDAPSLGSANGGSAPNLSALNLNTVSSPIAPPTPASPAKGTPAPPAAEKKAASSGGQIVPAQLLTRKEPEYPKLARETGAKGTVELVATIGADGKVKSVKVVHGPPMLVKAASDAVMQWKYRPTMLNGVPVEAQTQVFVNFLGGDR